MAPLKHLSASAISDYLECPMLHYGRRIAHWPETKPPFLISALTLGSVVDKALTGYHRGENPEAMLTRLWSALVTFPLVWSDGYRRALEMIRAYTSNVQPQTGDVCQAFFSLDIQGIPIPVIGYRDVVRGSQTHEIKTTSSATLWTQEKADTELQGSVYWLAFVQANPGKRPTLIYHILRHGEDTTYTEIKTKRTDADMLRTRALIRGTWEAMKDGELTAKCKQGRCRFPDRCTEYGYQPGVTDSPQEMVVSGVRESPVAGWEAFT